MKSSTLHRSSLTKEKMSLIENIRPRNYSDGSTDINQYINFEKKPELDVLWRDFEKNVQPSSVKTKAKAPIVYAGIGFVLGLLFALGIALIIGISIFSDSHKSDFEKGAVNKPKAAEEATVSVTPSATGENAENGSLSGEERYTIKEGDTLDKIAVRFYGRYDQEKIDEIMRLNNIKDPTRIQIGQVIIVPLN